MQPVRIALGALSRFRDKAPQLRELLAFKQVEAVLGEDAAVQNLIGVTPEEDRDVVAEVVRSVFGRRYSPLALGRQV